MTTPTLDLEQRTLCPSSEMYMAMQYVQSWGTLQEVGVALTDQQDTGPMRLLDCPCYRLAPGNKMNGQPSTTTSGFDERGGAQSDVGGVRNNCIKTCIKLHDMISCIYNTVTNSQK